MHLLEYEMNLQTFLKGNPKKHLIFDFDETIAWARIDWHSLQKQRYDYLSKLLPGIVKNDNGRSSSSRVDEAIQQYGDEVYDKLMEEESKLELENCSGFTPNPEIVAFIQEHESEYNFYVWSSNTLELINKGLSELSILESFNKIVSKDKVKLIKPRVYGFFEIYQQDSLLSDYLMIGNSEYNDGGAAKSVGIDFYHVTYFLDN
jgi:FMN phosphatase YigB (HAD superfamily)